MTYENYNGPSAKEVRKGTGRRYGGHSQWSRLTGPQNVYVGRVWTRTFDVRSRGYL